MIKEHDYEPVWGLPEKLPEGRSSSGRDGPTRGPSRGGRCTCRGLPPISPCWSPPASSRC
ncbi:hypothetical protein [Dankookia sp. P2]|uniref:hypothetical protein n=1 Tax=Dankookia sp. P2 TaxID=3423955 RepID=UPI003D6691C5